MDVIGGAASLVTLLELGIKVYGTAQRVLKVYKDGHALTKRDQDLENYASLFVEDNNRMIMEYKQHKSLLASEDTALYRINLECRETVQALLEALDSLRVHGDKSRKSRLRMALEEAVGSTRQTKVEACERKLLSLQNLLNLRLLGLVSKNVTKGLRRIEATIERSQLELASQFTQAKNELLHAIETQAHDAIAGALKQIQVEARFLDFRKDILSSLMYPDIRKRSSEVTTIADSDIKTFEWIFDEQQGLQSTDSRPVRYLRWLEDENGAFWVTGKPGCGKSTLMKFISTDPRTRNSLLKWAQKRRLIIASHYFWLHGKELQRSCEGLFRSLLWEVLCLCPDSIEIVCQARWNEAVSNTDSLKLPWGLDELRKCLAVLGEKSLYSQGQELCFCLFIDGLDEFRGEYHDVLQMVEMLRVLAESPHVKICTSSRDKPVFRDAFAARNLALHLYTTEDIEKVVRHELDSRTVKRSKGGRDLTFLVSEIVRKAEGVFLWVVLVIRRELLKKLDQDDSVDELCKRLDKVPAGLEEYFQHIFEQIDTDYGRISARIFLTCSQASEPLPIDILEMLDSKQYLDPTAFTKNQEISRTYRWGDLSSIANVYKWVNGRCQELMCVHPSRDQYVDAGTFQNPDSLAKIEFFHRSVVDFLQDPRIHDKLCDAAGPDFDVSRTLFAGYIFLLKKAPTFLEHSADSGRSISTNWSTYALLHERNSKQPVDRHLLDDLDKAMSFMCEGISTKHWTNTVAYGPSASETDSQLYVREQGQRNLIAHVIETGLANYTVSMLHSEPSAIKEKQGRPYLDYALRHAKDATYREFCDIPYDTQLVHDLLSLGCKPNQAVYINEDKTVFDLFIKQLYERRNSIDKEVCADIVRALIKHGAVEGSSFREYEHVPTSTISSRYQQKTILASDREMQLKREIPFTEVLTQLFGDEVAVAMLKDMARNNSWFSNLQSWWR